MFTALNRFIARLDADPQGQKANNRRAYGFQVLKNTNPDLPLEPWYDFVVGINGHDIDNPDGSLFATEVRNCAGNSINLGLWSAKGQRFRTIYVAVDAASTSLGLSLQWGPLTVTEEVWHILDVTPNSPADQAGLLPYGDYIIGSSAGLVRGESGFGELVEDHLERDLELYVYNHEYNVTRPVTIQPSRTWGGQGALGCVLGYGALHRIPAPLDEPPQAPGETLFETARLSTDAPRPSTDTFTPSRSDTPQYLVPADSSAYGMPPKDPSKPPQGKSKRQHPKATSDIDALFAEGEAKSREVDHAPSPKPSSGLAPPPKAGAGPPRAASPLKSDNEKADGEGDGAD